MSLKALVEHNVAKSKNVFRIVLVAASMFASGASPASQAPSLPRGFEGSFVGRFGDAGTCYLTLFPGDRFSLDCGGEAYSGRIEGVGDGFLLSGVKRPRIPAQRPPSQKPESAASDPTLPLAVTRKTGPPTWLKGIVWGERTYLVPPDSLGPFCADAGAKKVKVAKLPDGYFIRIGDDKKPRPKGSPAECQQPPK